MPSEPWLRCTDVPASMACSIGKARPVLGGAADFGHSMKIPDVESTIGQLEVAISATDKNASKMLQYVVTKASTMKPGETIAIPLGWSNPSLPASGQRMIGSLHCVSNDSFSLGVTNCGSGSEWHPMRLSEPLAHKEHVATLWLEDIPAHRVQDSTTWFMLLRLLLYPSESNTASQLYDKVLPALNEKPLLANLRGEDDWRELPYRFPSKEG